MLGVACLWAASAASQTVTDGDTLKFNGITYRLWGIDAPELQQTCADGWTAGQMSATYMKGLIEGRTVTCEPKTKDRYGRTVAICKADGQDLGGSMVSAGMAWAFIRYSQDYVVQEYQARIDAAGIHGNDCEKAWEWRAQHRPVNVR